MKLIILDRDGVINQDLGTYVKSPDDWTPIPGSLEAITRFNHAGYRVVIATNQAGIGKGQLDIETLNRVHEKMHRLAHQVGGVIEAVFFCPSADDANPCRKPNPGLFLEIAQRLRVHLHEVPAVGDSLRDIQAALAVGARPFLVRTGKGEKTLTEHGDSGIEVCDDLAAVADYLLS